MQGISPNEPSLAIICLGNICKSSYLWTNSLRRRAGNFFPARGIDLREQGVGREFGAKAIRAPAHPIALKYFIAVDIK